MPKQLLSESLLLALVGGLLGLVLAAWTNDPLARRFLIDGEDILKLRLNLRGLLFALIASSASGIAFGLAPAWLASRTNVNNALKQGAKGTTGDRSQHRIQHSLILAEVALALMLLAGASLVVTGLRGFASPNPGWQVNGLTLGYLTLPQSTYGDGNTLRAFASRLEERLTATPGVWGPRYKRPNATSTSRSRSRATSGLRIAGSQRFLVISQVATGLSNCETAGWRILPDAMTRRHPQRNGLTHLNCAKREKSASVE